MALHQRRFPLHHDGIAVLVQERFLVVRRHVLHLRREIVGLRTGILVDAGLRLLSASHGGARRDFPGIRLSAAFNFGVRSGVASNFVSPGSLQRLASTTPLHGAEQQLCLHGPVQEEAEYGAAWRAALASTAPVLVHGVPRCARLQEELHGVDVFLLGSGHERRQPRRRILIGRRDARPWIAEDALHPGRVAVPGRAEQRRRWFKAPARGELLQDHTGHGHGLKGAEAE
mmetsp:Transcript_9867/g.28992  ORF Transcript_9867/g.28992 Transcript_9867/m.28992 type:complete len:229 (+) Transcript_9867:910-1596(+)